MLGRTGWWATAAIGAAALLVIGLRPSITAQSSPLVALMVTPGAESAAIDRVMDSLRPGLVVRTPGSETPYPVVRDLEQLGARYPNVESVVLVGWGLEAELWDTIPLPVGHVPADLPPGIVADFPRSLALGRTLHITGRVDGRGVGIELRAPEGMVDSGAVATDGVFNVSYTPRASGPLELSLTMTGDTTITETVAVEIVTPPAIRVLMLDAAPSFEASSLRRWLAAGGAAVTRRTAVAMRLYQEEFVNTDEAALGTITGSLLRRFDLVVIDQRSLLDLTAAERRNLRRAIADDGLGLLLLTETDLDVARLNQADRSFFFDAAWVDFPELERRSVRPQWPDGAGPPTVPLTTAPAVMEASFGHAPVVDDGAGGGLAQVMSRGAGAVGLVVGMQTVQWRQHGHDGAYASLWYSILSRVARDPPDMTWWRVVSAAPTVVDGETLLRGRSGEDGTLVIAGPNGSIDSVASWAPDADPARQVRYWPRLSGWHRIDPTTDDGLWYVHQAGAWQRAVAQRRVDATAHAVLRSEHELGGDTVTTHRPMPLGWAYGVFLAAAALLWLAEDRTPARNPGS